MSKDIRSKLAVGQKVRVRVRTRTREEALYGKIAALTAHAGAPIIVQLETGFAMTFKANGVSYVGGHELVVEREVTVTTHLYSSKFTGKVKAISQTSDDCDLDRILLYDPAREWTFVGARHSVERVPA